MRIYREVHITTFFFKLMNNNIIQNPPDFKKPEHLKQQMTKLQHAFKIKRAI